MSTFERVLQIIHVSDLHFQAGSEVHHGKELKKNLGWVLKLARSLRLRPAESWLEESIVSLSAHNVSLEELEVALRGPLLSGNGWEHTWLLQSGDISAWGGAVSIREAHDSLSRICDERGWRLVSIYGNHDTWPAGFPWPRLLLASHPAQVTNRIRDLRGSGFFLPTYPQSLGSIRTGYSGSLDAFVLDTVSCNPTENIAALGNTGLLAPDQYKDSLNPQLAELTRALRSSSARVRIIIGHHPVDDYLDYRAGPTMHLRHCDVVAGACGESSAGVSSLNPSTLVLCGHYHYIHPDALASPDELKRTYQSPLRPGQLQLATGSALKKEFVKVTVRPPNRAGGDGWVVRQDPCLPIMQILRFYWLPEENRYRLDRLVLERRGPAGFEQRSKNVEVYDL